MCLQHTAPLHDGEHVRLCLNTGTKSQDYNLRMHPVLRLYLRLSKAAWYEISLQGYFSSYMSIATKANNNVVFTATHTYNKVIYERDK